MNFEIQNLILCSFRSLGFLMVLPLGGSLIRVGIKIILSLLIANLILKPTESLDLNLWEFPKEFILGFFIGLPITLITNAASLWGALFDDARGQTIGSVYDPNSNLNQPYFALLMQNLVWIFILQSGVLYECLSCLKLSLDIYPIGSKYNLSTTSLSVMVMIEKSLSLTFQAFLPLCVLLFTIDILLGVVSKLIPRLSIVSDSFHIKSIVAFLFAILLIDQNLLRSIPLISGSIIKIFILGL
ncbi:MAG: flagellar biosynthetic protein FliR [bacterium]|nr:flagellar biosynthetic protein FliR [bacterium]